MTWMRASTPTKIRLAITIDKGIPLPARRIDNGGPTEIVYKYPWPLLLEVGDSFFVPHGKYDLVGAAARQYGARTGTRYTVRKVDGGCRCWRIK